MKPLVSIVTPSLNKVQFIRESIESVLSQDYPSVEHVVMDGGSTDGTLDVLKDFEGRITVVSEVDRGQSHALNKGFRRSTGEILGWLNSDDRYYPGALSAVVSFFEENPDAMVVYGRIDFLDEEGRLWKRHEPVPFDYDVLLNGYCFVPSLATFMRREVFEAVGDFDESLKMAMDYDYWLRAGRRFPFQHLPRTLGGQRIMEGTKTGIAPTIAAQEALAVSRRHGGRYFSHLRLACWLWNLGLENAVRWVATRYRRRLWATKGQGEEDEGPRGRRRRLS